MSDRPNVNPSPRTRFQAVNGHIQAHRSMIELPAFDRGADAALIEYAATLSKSVATGNEAMANGFKIQGAMEFLQFFKTIAEQPQPMPVRKDLDNLPHNNLTRQ